jgi:hypothetical protein
MAKKPVYQFKITLQDIKPEIWRRIQISDMCNFWDLHVAIQDAMGWYDCHVHQFDIIDSKSDQRILMGIPDDDGCNETLSGWNYRVRDYISENYKMNYLYDFGDNWCHLIEYEGEKGKEDNQKYPRCIGGERACPPEDVGSIPGYYRFLKIISNPKDDDYENMLNWIGGRYDPKLFEPKDVRFDNSRQRWKRRFE